MEFLYPQLKGHQWQKIMAVYLAPITLTTKVNI